MTTFHAWDGNSWTQHNRLVDAVDCCTHAIQEARIIAHQDGEWPDWVEDIVVTRGASDHEDPSELPVVRHAQMIDMHYPSSALDDDGYDSCGERWESQSDFACDFTISSPSTPG